eukprot:TRINITY_DN3120_c0_g1_i14.p1 TRINITY_DN3120_c0_g1~~TRINITY_DN3120_c0_g1_i14.p1  ORF type:complete len:539 (+),score=80.68 TRINITY_DN3120_c0_g1_i14:110-1726(+)
MANRSELIQGSQKSMKSTVSNVPPFLVVAFQKLAYETSGFFSTQKELNTSVQLLLDFLQVHKSVATTLPYTTKIPQCSMNFSSFTATLTGSTVPQKWEDLDMVSQWDVFVNVLVMPLAIAIRNQILVETVFECLNKLLIYGYVQPNTPDLISPGPLVESEQESETERVSNYRRLTERILEIIAEYLKNFQKHIESQISFSSTEEKKMMQLLNVMAVVVDLCPLKGKVLMSTVRSLFQISLFKNSFLAQFSRDLLYRTMGIHFGRLGDDDATGNRLLQAGGVFRPPFYETPDSFFECGSLVTEFCLITEKPSPDAYNYKPKNFGISYLLGIFERFSKDIKSSPRFITEFVKNHVCMALCTVIKSYPYFFAVALEIFGILVKEFRKELKPQIGVLFSMLFSIFDPIHESIHKKTHEQYVLLFFSHLLQFPDIICDLYLNYDCDVNALPILAKIVDLLTRYGMSNKTLATVVTCPVQYVQTKCVEMKTGVIFQFLESTQPVYLYLDAFCNLLISLIKWSENFRQEVFLSTFPEPNTNAPLE